MEVRLGTVTGIGVQVEGRRGQTCLDTPKHVQEREPRQRQDARKARIDDLSAHIIALNLRSVCARRLGGGSAYDSLLGSLRLQCT